MPLFHGVVETPMREAVHSARLDVRVPPELLAATETVARSRMMSRGELVRAALRREVLQGA